MVIVVARKYAKKDNIPTEKDIVTHVVAVFGIIQKADKFLISKRKSDDPQAGGMWSIPGGKVESIEGKHILEDQLKKEIMEEVGIKIEDEIYYLLGEGFVRISGHHVVGLTFLCKWKSGIASPLEDQEEIKWLALEELKNMRDLPEYLAYIVKCLEGFLKK